MWGVEDTYLFPHSVTSQGVPGGRPHSATGNTAGGNNQRTLVWEWKLKPRDNNFTEPTPYIGGPHFLNYQACYLPSA